MSCQTVMVRRNRDGNQCWAQLITSYMDEELCDRDVTLNDSNKGRCDRDKRRRDWYEKRWKETRNKDKTWSVCTCTLLCSTINPIFDCFSPKLGDFVVCTQDSNVCESVLTLGQTIWEWLYILNRIMHHTSDQPILWLNMSFPSWEDILNYTSAF